MTKNTKNATIYDSFNFFFLHFDELRKCWMYVQYLLVGDRTQCSKVTVRVIYLHLTWSVTVINHRVLISDGSLLCLRNVHVIQFGPTAAARTPHTESLPVLHFFKILLSQHHIILQRVIENIEQYIFLMFSLIFCGFLISDSYHRYVSSRGVKKSIHPIIQLWFISFFLQLS